MKTISDEDKHDPTCMEPGYGLCDRCRNALSALPVIAAGDCTCSDAPPKIYAIWKTWLKCKRCGGLR